MGSDQPPPGLYQALLSLVSGSHATVSSLDTWIRTDFKSTELANAATTFPLLDAVVRTFAIFRQEHTSRQHLSAAIVESIIANNLDLETLRKLPFGLSLPLYQPSAAVRPTRRVARTPRSTTRFSVLSSFSTLRCSVAH